MFLGWKTLYVEADGTPVNYKTDWYASCFVFFTVIIWVGKVCEVKSG